MNVIIDNNTLPLLEAAMQYSGKSAIRIKKTGYGCGGLLLEILPDDVSLNDEFVLDHDIMIIADKSISFYFDNALITHKETSNGNRFKLKTQ